MSLSLLYLIKTTKQNSLKYCSTLSGASRGKALRFSVPLNKRRQFLTSFSGKYTSTQIGNDVLYIMDGN